MPSLNFTVFTEKVADGRKPHTIRATRNVPFKVGDDLSFFTGMRTKACRRLRMNQPCVGAPEIRILPIEQAVHLNQGSHYYRTGMLRAAEIEKLARADGFETVDEFFAYFGRSGVEFKGQLVEWTP